MGADWYYVHTENTIMSMCACFFFNHKPNCWFLQTSCLWFLTRLFDWSLVFIYKVWKLHNCFVFFPLYSSNVGRLMWDQSFNSKNVIDLRIKDIFIPRRPFSEDPNKLWCKMDKINKNLIKYLRYLSTLGKKYSPNSSLYGYKPHTLYKRCRCHPLVC